MSEGRHDQRARWRRLEAWENDRLRLRPADFPQALAWMSEAWELAGCLNRTGVRGHDRPAFGIPEVSHG